MLTNHKAMGLTHSWNIGYEFAIRMGYQYLIFMNNDVLVTAKGVQSLLADLKKEVVVVPLTSQKGAGHNIIQVFEKLFQCRV